MNKKILFLVFLIVCVSFVSGTLTEFNITHGFNANQTTITSVRAGINITALKENNISTVIKFATDTAPTCLVYNGVGFLLATGSYSGRSCILNQSVHANVGDKFYIVDYNSGANYNYAAYTGATIFSTPKDMEGYFNITSGVYFSGASWLKDTARLYAVNNLTIIYDVIPIYYSLNISDTYPSDNTGFNTNQISFSILVNSTYDYNCSLYLNSTLNDSMNNLSLGLNKNVTFNESLSQGNWTYFFSCVNNETEENSSVKSFFIDTSVPVSVSDFVNGSIFWESLSAVFNLSDNILLYRYNISVDGVDVENSLLSTDFYQVNFSYDLENVSYGLHNLSLVVADGHTSHYLLSAEAYNPSNGIFNNYMRFDFEYPYKDGFVMLEGLPGSLFDSFNAEYNGKDRFKIKYKPNRLDSSYSFDLVSSEYINILESDNDFGGKWVVFGEHWFDFDIPSQPDLVVDIVRVNDKKVRVTLSGIDSSLEELEFNSVGDINVVTYNYSFYKVNVSVIYQNTVFEGSLVTHILEINSSNVSSLGAEAFLIWNGSDLGSGVETLVSSDSLRFVQSFVADGVDFDIVNWSWFFNFSGSDLFNISGNQSFVSMNITNCSSGNVVLNYTIFDEKNRTVASSGLLELDLTIRSYFDSSLSWDFNIIRASSNLAICLPDSFLNVSDYVLDAICRYSYSSHEVEYHYIESFNLSKGNTPVEINLYDLLSSDSTSFLIFYQDENYLYVDGAIIDVLRYYPGNGSFLSVEHSRTDESGQALGHLVAEDVIYKFNVWIDGVLDYSTSEYLALCQTAPCQINLRKVVNDSVSFLTLDDLLYSISTNSYVRTNRVVVFGFSTTDGTSTDINLTVKDSLDNVTVCSSLLSSSAGSVSCSIPISYANETYVAYVWRDDILVGYKNYYLDVLPSDIFGQDGVYMSFMGFLTLGLAGISSGIASIFLGILGIIIMGMMNFIYVGSVFGLGSTIVWLVVAGGLIIYKISKRRVH